MERRKEKINNNKEKREEGKKENQGPEKKQGRADSLQSLKGLYLLG